MMKVALPSRDNQVDDHFGHCEYFTIFTINNDREIVGEEKLKPGVGCGCKSNVVLQLAALGVETMLAGNIGTGAVDVLGAHGIRVVRGCSGDVRGAVEAWLDGATTDSGKSCAHHGECH
jgi:predicted Fe-Mo cluster-binding NifX family protein